VSRVISTDSVGKKRHQLRRTIAEALRRMASKRAFDRESQDLAALIVFSLRRLEEGIEQTASAWEKRDYWLKADRFRMQWAWLEDATYSLESALLLGQWDKVPEIMALLFPQFADITIAKYTRSSDLWDGAYQRLVNGERSSETGRQQPSGTGRQQPSGTGRQQPSETGRN
jgi:hypothetical protein